jgi:hypothetical protein
MKITTSSQDRAIAFPLQVQQHRPSKASHRKLRQIGLANLSRPQQRDGRKVRRASRHDLQQMTCGRDCKLIAFRSICKDRCLQ